jgi:putative DNA methylase
MERKWENLFPPSRWLSLGEADNSRKVGPWSLHLWWNRSPIESSKVLLESLLEGKKKDDTPVICDPFCGSGGLLLAAESLGLPVKAGDLNGLAVLISKALGEIPQSFTDHLPVHPGAESLVYEGVAGLQEDIRYYGNKLKEQVEEENKNLYTVTTEEGEKDFFARILVRTIPCPNPACGVEMPLSNSFILSQQKGRECWAEPIYEKGKLHFHLHQGPCPPEKVTNKHGSKGSRFQCPCCGTMTTDDYVRTMGKEGKMHAQSMALCLESKEGRVYVEDKIEKGTAKESHPSLGLISTNTRWFSTPEYGLKDYGDLYTDRQYRIMEAFCQGVTDIGEIVFEDARKAGMEKGEPLAQGGTGALAYSEAIRVYLALVVSKLSNFQSTIVTWDPRRGGNSRAAFNRHMMPMTWTFAEVNPFGKATGNFEGLLKQVVSSLETVPLTGKGRVEEKNAEDFPFPQNSILFTEFPYYDHVGYADLSDYFYVWLRSMLKDVYPSLFEGSLSRKEELTSAAAPDSRGPLDGEEAYEREMARFFAHFYGSASSSWSSLVFFRCTTGDVEALTQGPGRKDMSRLEHFLDAIGKAGFTVDCILPLRSDKIKGTDFIRIAVIFGKPREDRSPVTRRGFLQSLKRELQEPIEDLLEKGGPPEDVRIYGLGMGLRIRGQSSKVYNADGSEMTVADVVYFIDQEVRNVIDARKSVCVSQ